MSGSPLDGLPAPVRWAIIAIAWLVDLWDRITSKTK